MPLPMNVAVLFGGPSPEHDVSILTGLQAVHAVEGARRTAHAIYWSKSGEFYLTTAREAEEFADGPPADARPLALVAGEGGGFRDTRARRGRVRSIDVDVAVVCTHGGPGEDGSLQGALDLARVPYSGPSVAAAALGMDKLASGDVARAAGLATLDRMLFGADTERVEFAAPFIVKPRFGGSSIGIDVVADLATAHARLSSNPHLARGAVIEPYRAELFDLQIAVLTYPELTLSAIERPVRARPDREILGYTDKYVEGSGMAGARRELPAALGADVVAHIHDMARRAATALGVRGVARLDFLSDGDAVYFNEVNTVPGSLARHLFVDPPMSFVALIEAIAAEATERPAAVHSSLGADGTLLRSADRIASKLG